MDGFCMKGLMTWDICELGALCQTPITSIFTYRYFVIFAVACFRYEGRRVQVHVLDEIKSLRVKERAWSVRGLWQGWPGYQGGGGRSEDMSFYDSFDHWYIKSVDEMVMNDSLCVLYWSVWHLGFCIKTNVLIWCMLPFHIKGTHYLFYSFLPQTYNVTVYDIVRSQLNFHLPINAWFGYVGYYVVIVLFHPYKVIQFL